MKLSVVIVNWNSVNELRGCLTSLPAGVHSLELETIVIDNASHDGSAELVAREFPGVEFIQSKVNAGFAVANNCAVRHATGEYVAILNPDTEVQRGALEVLVDALRNRPDAGIAGPRLLNQDGSVQESVQAFPTLLSLALDMEFLRRHFPKSELWGTASIQAGTVISKVNVISGACMVMRTELFRQMGGFSESFFMYSEDVDLCWKLAKLSLSVLYVPEATIIHSGGQSSDRRASHFSSVLQRDSGYLFFRNTRGVFYATAYRLLMTVVALIRLAILAPAVILTFGERKASLIHSFGKWLRILQWGIGGQRWARQLSEQLVHLRCVE